MKLAEDTNKKVYLNYITTRNYFTNEECTYLITECRLIEQAYLTTLHAIDDNDNDGIGKIYPGRTYGDEDFYIVITNPKSDHIYHLENLREYRKIYGANTEDLEMD